MEAWQAADPEAARRACFEPFDIISEKVSLPGLADAKGYKRVRFEEAWEAYLPGQNHHTHPFSPISETSKRPYADGSKESSDFRSVLKDVRDGSKNANLSYSHAGKDAWTDRKPGNGVKGILTRKSAHPSTDRDPWDHPALAGGHPRLPEPQPPPPGGHPPWGPRVMISGIWNDRPPHFRPEVAPRKGRWRPRLQLAPRTQAAAARLRAALSFGAGRGQHQPVRSRAITRNTGINRATPACAANEGKQPMSSPVLTPQSLRWDQFAERLYAALDREGCDGDNRQNHELVHRHAKAIMRDMGNIDIAGSLAFFEDHGGYCDCEILWNVDPDEAGGGAAIH